MTRPTKRAEQEGLAAAQSLFALAGCGFRAERGGKHLHAVAILPDGRELKIPVSGSPGHGDGGSAWLVERTGRRALRAAGISIPRAA